MKQLLICRHAKSSWKDPDLRDFDRPLNKRGQGDAPEMGRRLAAQRLRPDLICSSSAVRARETALHYAEQIGYPIEGIRFNPNQYTASVASLLSLIQAIDPKVATLMLVGHNPESTMLANFLSGHRIDNIPTCGIVALAFAVSNWQDITPGAGNLLFFDYPKNQS